MNYKFGLAALGGTFDHLHAGHKQLLDRAFENSAKVIIGLVTDSLLTDKSQPQALQSHKTRKIELVKYLDSMGYSGRSEIVDLTDIYGPTVTDRQIEAVFATEDNLKNLKKINLKRVENGFSELEQVLVPFVFSTDNMPVSSSRIRSGEIDREGNLYFDLFGKKKRFNLPEELRPALKKPFGKVIKKLRPNNLTIQQFSHSFTIAVGDIAAINLYRLGIQADISIIDYKTMRHGLTEDDQKELSKLQSISTIMRAVNQPGTIERRAVGVLKKALSNLLETKYKQVVLIEGEEDLMTIPAILLSPLETFVLYGQPEKGIVVVKVTEKKKKEASSILSKMR